MEIRYKFNKSSEARDCVAESVELRQLIVNKTKVIRSDNSIDELYSEKLSESKIFTSQQELKDYISTIQEQVEFIAESDIDQVLMKEWIGEWETKQVLNQILGRDYTYWETVYVGSPKLNSNWTFKIK